MLLSCVSRLVEIPVRYFTISVGVHSVPGGVFPIPPAAQHLMTLLPPPTCFQVFYGLNK